MLQARVCDPAGPRRWRVATAVGLLPLAFVAFALPLPLTARWMTMLLGLAWLAVGRLVVPRLRPRACTVVLESGAIRLTGAGAASQRVRAGEVRGASTAILPDGSCAIALVRHEHGDPPLWLALDSKEDVDRIRRALGVGYVGFGSLRWPSARGGFHGTASAADVLAALGWLGILAATGAGATELALGLALAVVPLTLVAMVAATTTRPRQHGVQLSPLGVKVIANGRSAFLPWKLVADAKVEGSTLALRTGNPSETERVPMSEALPAEREHMAAQIRSAARRARGEGVAPPELPASLAALSPRDEDHRAWLERLDATAASMAHGGGYRHTSVEAQDLWTALDNPDLPPNLRAAAARILARVAPEQAGDRIARALSMEHDPRAQQHIRVVLEEDVELAARELDRLDVRGERG